MAELSLFDTPLHIWRHEDDLPDLVYQLSTALLSIPLFHQVLDFFEFPQVELFLIGEVALFELVPPG